jgi:hypothetical protein
MQWHGLTANLEGVGNQTRFPGPKDPEGREEQMP